MAFGTTEIEEKRKELSTRIVTFRYSRVKKKIGNVENSRNTEFTQGHHFMF